MPGANEHAAIIENRGIEMTILNAFLYIKLNRSAFFGEEFVPRTTESRSRMNLRSSPSVKNTFTEVTRKNLISLAVLGFAAHAPYAFSQYSQNPNLSNQTKYSTLTSRQTSGDNNYRSEYGNGSNTKKSKKQLSQEGASNSKITSKHDFDFNQQSATKKPVLRRPKASTKTINDTGVYASPYATSPYNNDMYKNKSWESANPTKKGKLP